MRGEAAAELLNKSRSQAMYLYNIGNEAAGDHAVGRWERELKKDFHSSAVCACQWPRVQLMTLVSGLLPAGPACLIIASIVCSISRCSSGAALSLFVCWSIWTSPLFNVCTVAGSCSGTSQLQSRVFTLFIHSVCTSVVQCCLVICQSGRKAVVVGRE